MKKLIYLISASVILILMTDCMKCNNVAERFAEKVIEENIERSSGKKVDIDYGGSGRRVKIPAIFPRQLIPPGGKAINKVRVNTDEGTAITLTFETRRRLERVISFYKNLAGWRSLYTAENAEGTSIALDGDGETAIINIGEENSKTIVTVIYTKKH